MADHATGWMNGNVGKQRFQRVSSAGEQPSVAAAWKGPNEAMKQALAASSAKEAYAASNAKGVGVCCEQRCADLS